MKRLVFTVLAVCAFSIASAQSHWEPAIRSFENGVDDVILTRSGAVFAAVAFDGLYRSVDTLATWQKVFDENIQAMAVDRADSSELYVATLAGVYLSENDGETWDQILPAETWSLHVSGGDIVAGGGGGQIYWSTDAGDSWSVPSCRFMPAGYDSYVDPVYIRDQVILYVHAFSDFFATTTPTAGWEIDGEFGPDFIIDDADENVYANDGDNILRSADGHSWSLHAETPYFSLEDLAIRGNQWAVASFSGLAVSKDGGTTWVDWTEGLTDDRANGVAIADDGRVYAATSCCVRRSLEPIEESANTSTERSPEIPQTDFVSAPYPNPGSGDQVIPFVVAQSGHVEVAIYDALGRKLETIVSTYVPAGKHEIRWDGGRLPAGNYFIRLEMARRAVTRNVTIVR